jgi:hypothetical protein
MNTIAQTGAAIGLFGAGAGMAIYEWTRIKAGRPILKGHPAIELYWTVYLTFLVLGTTLIFAAIFR